MPRTDTSLFDYAVSYGMPSLFMTAVFVFVLPLVYFKFARRRYARWPARVAVLCSAWLMALTVAYGDVLWIAWHAQRLCETEAGLRVYRAVEVEGFLGESDIATWARHGFRYLESRDLLDAPVRHELVDGRQTVTPASALQSLYEYSYASTPAGYRLSRQQHEVRPIGSRNVLGTLTTFTLFPGWLDRYITAGAGWTPIVCEGPGVKKVNKLELRPTALIERTLRPKPGR
jgi:hypothetical protein